ncbi:MAG: hypothetical protein COC01_03430, partial [Bacteroidetes bacterium]
MTKLRNIFLALTALLISTSSFSQRSIISAGGSHSLFICADSTVWACGYNYTGAMGNGKNKQSLNSNPEQTLLLTGVIEVAAGNAFSKALKADGTVWGWGKNSSYEIGDGTTIERDTAVQLPGVSGIVKIFTGTFSTNGLKSDSTLWLLSGTSSGTQDTTIYGVIDIGIGGNHSIVLTGDGQVWGIGLNSYGGVGDGSTTSKSVWTASTGVSNAIKIAAGQDHSLALLQDGTVMAWGANTNGETGDGTTFSPRPTPQVVPGLTNIIDVIANTYSSFALDNKGYVWGWGNNGLGQLGTGDDLTDHPSPVKLTSIRNVVQIQSLVYHTIAITGDGTIYSWGWNNDGQLGDNTDSTRYESVPVAIGCKADVICTPPTADFDSSVTALNVTFINQSSFPDSISWDFGDGNLSNEFDPAHTYADTGIYNVCITAVNSCGSNKKCMDVVVSDLKIPYCIPSADCSWGDAIKDFTFNTISNLNTSCDSSSGYHHTGLS